MDALLIPPALLALGAAGVARGSETAALARAALLGWTALAATLALALLAALQQIAAPGLTLVAMALTGFVGAVVLAFSQRYLRADPRRSAYGAKVLLLLAAVMLFAAARDVVTLAIGWLVSGWTLAALIGHVRDWDAAQAARRTALLHFAVGDVALVAALATLAWRTGSLSLDALAAAPGDVETLAAALLLVIAAAVRCALPPAQRWLTRSMTAPTPVSALMHAGFVNGGGLLLIRFAPLLEAAPAARWAAVAIGFAAALAGSAMMLVRPDIKRNLAGSTCAQMGFMLMTCGLGAYAAALWHLAAHALFKAWLFLRSGSAIGLGVVPPAVAMPPLGVALIGLIATGGTALLAATGLLTPATVPVTLALAAVIAALPRLGSAPSVAALGLAILGSYAAGLWATERLIDHPAGPLLGGAPLPVVLVAGFMTAWLAQALVARGRIALPAALYARLLNA